MLLASRMARFSSLLAAAAFVAANAAAQALLPVGTHDLAWANPTTAGSATLFARVYYPATVAGFDTPPLPSPSGWPTVVFLHGYGQIGSDYGQLASAWSEQGYAVVALDTARFDFAMLRDDGHQPGLTIIGAGPEEEALRRQTREPVPQSGQY